MRLKLSRMPFLVTLLSVFGIVILTLSLLAQPVFAKEIKVKLVWKFAQAGWLEIAITGGAYTLSGYPPAAVMPPGSVLQVGWGGLSPVIRLNHGDYAIFANETLELKPQGSGTFKIKDPSGTEVVYRGSLALTWQGAHWNLMNTLEEEDYLKGVVPMEMSNEWAEGAFEALKAQSVAARTFMARHTQNNQAITDSPDIDQAYLGKTVEGAASAAVEETKGEILIDARSRQPIDALYSSHNGGYTEDAKNVWGNTDAHYSSRPDPFSQGVGGAVDRWHFVISAPALGKTFGLGPIRRLSLDKLPSGRVKMVKMEDWLGQARDISGREFVKAFYPFGQPIKEEAVLGSLFSVEFIRSGSRETGSTGLMLSKGLSPGPRLDRMISSYQGIAPQSQPFGVYVINGRGWGHGVGMSQWGAYRMAQLGNSYRDILTYYYENTIIVQRE
ncbi:SpoIID/LytB domain-containing protein [Paradesulfitobacterium ferrireducens]|uniref:SpoIID/LytB domain-containing protein n=1 Tax=Paradesulfitobacterium ferrireducens TaxID=2816476 RepID=UPI002E2A2EE8|nr:SpoIID/LytB domain-containing protein [Paradesulfitobacterium ferrireducens]